MTPDQYCRDRTARSGSSFYYSFLLLPAPRRRAIMALYAFCREVDDVVDECREPQLARIKLAWWRQELDKVFDGDPEHPVGRALQPAVREFELDRALLHEIIDGMEMDLDGNRYPTFKELALYCHRVAGVVGLLAAEIFGYRERATRRYAELLGTAFQLTNILRDVREDAARNRLYLPLEELERFGHRPEALLRARESAPYVELFRFQAERARDYYRRAEEALPAVDRPAQRPGLVMAAVYRATLDQIEADGFRVLEHRIRLTPTYKLWLTLATLWRERSRG